MTLTLTDADREAWWQYEKAAAIAHRDYAHRPTRKPHVSGHYMCMACDSPTEQRAGVCLSCQRHDPEWRALAEDPIACLKFRQALSRVPRSELP